MIEARQEWPAELAERYRELGYWKGETIGEMLRRSVERTPEALAVVADDSRWTYAALDRRADALASGFRALGIAPGDRVLVQLPNRASFLSVVFGLFRAGAIPVFCLPAHRQAEISYFADASEAVAYIFPGSGEIFDYSALAAEVAATRPALRHLIVDGIADGGSFTTLVELEATHPSPLESQSPSSVAFLQLSGGSTGFSKLIPRTHDDYLYSVRESARICGLGPESVYMGTLPIAHNYPMSSPGFLGAIHAGSRIVLSPSPAPDVAFRLIEAERVTITGVVPPLALIWAQAAQTTQYDLSSLEVLQVGGAKLAPESARRIVSTFGAKLQQVFGMAEGLVNYTRLDDAEETIVNTQGRPISPDDEILVVDEHSQPVPAGVPGHLLTRGPYTIRGYHNAPAANARAFTSDGFYRTGDIVSRSAEGYLTVHGRATDQINRGGEKVSPDEVEDHLLAHPQIHDAAVIGIPDPYLGERTCAVLVAVGEKPTIGAVKGWVRSRGIAAFKVPDQVVFMSAFPETGVGKTSRKDLRAALRDLMDSDSAPETPSPESR